MPRPRIEGPVKPSTASMRKRRQKERGEAVVLQQAALQRLEAFHKTLQRADSWRAYVGETPEETGRNVLRLLRDAGIRLTG
jgi:hypothetical protein